uniref:Bestrophin homolog n=1 Tax=Heterorhabditis bacteriophora TaxID=37862 RepID=A0A1I7W9Z9_HETBA
MNATTIFPTEKVERFTKLVRIGAYTVFL